MGNSKKIPDKSFTLTDPAYKLQLLKFDNSILSDKTAQDVIIRDQIQMIETKLKSFLFHLSAKNEHQHELTLNTASNTLVRALNKDLEQVVSLLI